MRDVLALGGLYAYGAVLGLLDTGGPRRRAATVLLAALMLAAPFLIPVPHPLTRVAVALGLALGLFRAIELARDPRSYSAARRIWHCVALFDTRTATQVRPELPWRRLGALIAFLSGSAAAAVLVFWVAPGLQGPARPLLRWLGGVVLVYCSLDAVAALLGVLYQPFGVGVPLLHNAPILACSIQEFWSQRWNRVVSGWFRSNCFRPLARRYGAVVGLAASFALSAALHAYLTAVTAGARMALIMAGFFVLQLPLVAAERSLGVAHWSAPRARLWTIGTLLAASLLFVEPMLRTIDPR